MAAHAGPGGAMATPVVRGWIFDGLGWFRGFSLSSAFMFPILLFMDFVFLML